MWICVLPLVNWAMSLHLEPRHTELGSALLLCADEDKQLAGSVGEVRCGAGLFFLEPEPHLDP
jgi:hypothetical protein